MEGRNWACSLLVILFQLATLSESCLDGTIERLVSGSIYSVPDDLFEASSTHDGYPPQQAKLEGLSWCSSDSLTLEDRPWLQVTFKIKVNITIIQTGGYDGFLKDNYYITRFKVYVGDGTEGNLHALKASEDSAQAMVFFRKGTYRVENTVLPSPVTARVLRIEAVGWNPEEQVCLRLEALGCPMSSVPTTTAQPNTEAPLYTTQGTQSTEEISEASSYSTQKTTPTEEIFETSSYTTQQSILVLPQSRTMMVAGAVGGALSLVVVFLLIFIVVAAIFIFSRRRSAPVEHPGSCEINTEHRTTPLQSPCKDISDNRVENSKGEIKAENHPSLRDHPSSILSNIYESIAAPTTTLHEPIQDLNEIIDPQAEGMHNNPLYDKSSEEDLKMECDYIAPTCIPSSITVNTYEPIATILDDPVEDLNGTIASNKGMHDNPNYDKSNEESFKRNRSKPSISSCSTLDTYEPTVLHELIKLQDCDGTLDPQDEEMYDNPLYDKSNDDVFKMDSQDEELYDNPLYDKSNEDVSKIDPQDEELYDNPLYDKSNEDVSKFDPLVEGMHDNPLYDKNSEEDLRMDYHPTRPGLPAFITSNSSESTPTTNGTEDLND